MQLADAIRSNEKSLPFFSLVKRRNEAFKSSNEAFSLHKKINSELINSKILKNSLPISPKKIPEMNISDYSIIREIGSGSYATIYLAAHKSSGSLYALKKIITEDQDEMERIKEGILLAGSISSLTQNIVPILKYNIKELDFSTYVIYLLMPFEDANWEQEIKCREKMSSNKIFDILHQLVSTLCIMQKKNICHRDIKPQNVLIQHGLYKLCDFDEMIQLPNHEDLFNLEVKGTEAFLSPVLFKALRNAEKEVIHNPFKSDVYSLGLCLIFAATRNYELLKTIRRNNDKTNAQFIKRLFHNNEKLCDAVIMMLKHHEEERFDFIQLNKCLNH